jgi:ankyrin repeat protein
MNLVLVEKFISMGADVNQATTSNLTPLMEAAEKGCYVIMDRLL